MCPASKNFEKFKGSKSFKVVDVINLKSLSPVLVMISSMYVPICNRFHTILANNGKITSFRGYPSLTLSFEGNPALRGTKFCHDKLETLG